MAAPVFILDERQEALQGALQARWPSVSIEVLPGSGPQENLQWLFERCRQILTDKPSAPQPLLFLVADCGQASIHNGLTGLLKTVRLEQPRIAAKTVLHRATDDASIAAVVDHLIAEIDAADGDAEIRFGTDGRRQVRTLAELRLPDPDAGIPAVAAGEGGCNNSGPGA